tara:strand:+ start:153 stop:818 length:666 start_codon:yes stop_codon:yes gene_type:complete
MNLFSSKKDEASEGYFTYDPFNYGWIERRLSSQELDYVWRCIENKKGDYRSNLAGNITGSYGLADNGNWFYTNTMIPLCYEYAKRYRNLGDEETFTPNRHPYHMVSWWVNYQYQHEFNPVHFHHSTYSFVIWMKIPVSYKEQCKKEIVNVSNNKTVASFQFIYNDILGKLRTHDIGLEPEDEGRMLFFPSSLQHQVYPFYDCDEPRISVSGNISLNPNKVM